jgi:anti-sigma regulatory factor (Ser/Thr protein kinase)
MNMLKNEKCLSPDKYRGYGLRIMIEAFDDVSYNDKGNILTLIKYLGKNRKTR